MSLECCFLPIVSRDCPHKFTTVESFLFNSGYPKLPIFQNCFKWKSFVAIFRDPCVSSLTDRALQKDAFQNSFGTLSLADRGSPLQTVQTLQSRIHCLSVPRSKIRPGGALQPAVADSYCKVGILFCQNPSGRTSTALLGDFFHKLFSSFLVWQFSCF